MKQQEGAPCATKRDTWTGKLDFIFSVIAMAVGIGNVWRFPYICYKNGGGAFFIPYFIMVIFIACPGVFMEFCIGQFCSRDALKCRDFAPIFKGIGYSQLLILYLGSITYCQVIAYAMYYIGHSFTATLPWSSCDKEWNTPACREMLPDVECMGNHSIKYDNGSCYDNQTFVGLWDYNVFHNATGIQRTLASEEYFYRKVLSLSDGIHEVGMIQWQLVVSLLVAWILICLPLVKGIKTAGKIVYPTTIFPYIILAILLTRGLTLPHAVDGIIYFLKPQWHRLLDAKVWYDAAVQVIFSYAVCWGLLNTLSSYNDFRKNIFVDTIVIGIVNAGSSILAGFVVFSFLGFLSSELGEPISKVAQSGSGLAFVVYPDLVTRLPLSQLWSILFFIMLSCLGIDSMFAHMEVFMTVVMDHFPTWRKKKPLLAVLISLSILIPGLILCTQGGMYILYLMDTYSAGWALLFNNLLQVISVCYVYGIQRFKKDIELMLGKKPSIWWQICWQFASPALLIFVILFAMVDYGMPQYGDYIYPDWAQAIGWVVCLSIMIAVPLFAVYVIYKQKGSLKERLMAAAQPTKEWGPAKISDRELVDYVPGFVVNPWKEKNLDLNGHNHTLLPVETKVNLQEVTSDLNGYKLLPVEKESNLENITS